MNDHPGRLIDHYDIRVLVNDCERNWIGENLVDLGRRNLYQHDFARRHAELGFPLLTINAHTPGFDERLDGAPAQVGQLIRDVPIQALAEIVAVGPKLDDLIAFLFGA
jgi:hypothetical protein